MRPLATGARAGIGNGSTVRVRESRGQVRPLVYATLAASEQARRLLPGRVLEVEVADAILAGNVIGVNRSCRVLGDDWQAHVERVPGRLRPKPRAWLVLRLEARR